MNHKQEKMVSVLSLSECQIEHQIMIDLGTIQGEKFFDSVGEWVLQALAYFHVNCKEKKFIPCVHLETVLIPRPEFNRLLVEAFLDELGIVHRGSAETNK